MLWLDVNMCEVRFEDPLPVDVSQLNKQGADAEEQPPYIIRVIPFNGDMTWNNYVEIGLPNEKDFNTMKTLLT